MRPRTRDKAVWVLASLSYLCLGVRVSQVHPHVETVSEIFRLVLPVQCINVYSMSMDQVDYRWTDGKRPPCLYKACFTICQITINPLRAFKFQTRYPYKLASYRMADHRVPFQHANPLSANAYPHPALNQLQGQVRRVMFLTVVSFIVVHPRPTFLVL